MEKNQKNKTNTQSIKKTIIGNFRDKKNQNKINLTQILRDNEELQKRKQRKKNEVTTLVDVLNKTVKENLDLRKKIEALRKGRTMYDSILQKLERQIVFEESTLLKILHFNEMKNLLIISDIDNYNELMQNTIPESEDLFEKIITEEAFVYNNEFFSNIGEKPPGNVLNKIDDFALNCQLKKRIEKNEEIEKKRKTDIFQNTSFLESKRFNEIKIEKPIIENQKRSSLFIQTKQEKVKIQNWVSTNIFTKISFINPIEKKILMFEKLISEFKFKTEENNIDQLISFSKINEEQIDDLKNEVLILQNEVFLIVFFS